jgi:hypothetical protein
MFSVRSLTREYWFVARVGLGATRGKRACRERKVLSVYVRGMTQTEGRGGTAPAFRLARTVEALHPNGSNSLYFALLF